jgi:hypothetical protein
LTDDSASPLQRSKSERSTLPGSVIPAWQFQGEEWGEVRLADAY